MRGEVIHYDEAQGFGFITGVDGNRYTFARENLRRAASMPKGTLVEFKENGGQARDIFPLREMGATSPTVAPQALVQRTNPNFGRTAANSLPAGTGLWSSFWRGMTSNYANFRGRARRKEYWGYVLFFFLGLIALSLAGFGIDSALGNMDSGDGMPVATIVLVVLFVAAGIIPSVAIRVRRQHDIGLSGWFYLLIFIPYIGNLIIFVFSLIPSQKHDNKWGPVPPGIAVPAPFMPPASETPR